MYRGRGVAWKGDWQGEQEDELSPDLEEARIEQKIQEVRDGEESAETEAIELEDKRKLGIATLGALKQHPRISDFRRFIEGWYLSYFTPDAARSLPLAGPQKHLNIHGDNLGNVVQYMEREHKDKLGVILAKIAERVPGIDRITTEHSPDGRLLIRFNDRGFEDPFYAQQMSVGLAAKPPADNPAAGSNLYPPPMLQSRLRRLRRGSADQQQLLSPRPSAVF